MEGLWKEKGKEKGCNYIHDIKSKRKHNNNHTPQCDQQQEKENYFHQRGKSPMTNASVELVNILLIPSNDFEMVKSNM